ncbi:MAG: hypothetical protein A2X34_08300 [Elusimicrobia bacterium GWC2_51_8]|nr:MAG: hypothetical protein A2X33_02470 [Elusimicrobia bacterium GWA2_51_34]OGR59348.1 MAG: hypothetical protein A2X34_08300 [Elusimicrobia bacterium GWC2_51_8]OGR86977.1 MAG: hypothetical protein A2021_01440 [Elusimicrobia bacterium GWF2_52_66]
MSVVLATFNAGKTLQRCLDSFRAQDYPAKELILKDGGSSDNTLDIIRSNKDTLTYWESAPDGGIYNAWNKALPHVKGEWVYFIGADDYFLTPGVLSSAATLLRSAFPAYRVAYGRVDVVNAEGRVFMTAGDPWDRMKFLQFSSIPHQGVFQHKSLFAEYGLFDETFRITGDHEFLLRELKDKNAVFFPSLKVAVMSYGGVSSSPANSIRALQEIYRARRKHKAGGFPKLLYLAFFRAYVWKLIACVFGRAIADKAANIYRKAVGRAVI